MTIRTRPTTPEYEEGYDRIFRSKERMAHFHHDPKGTYVNKNKEEQSESNQERTSGRQGSSDAGTDTKAE